MFKKIIRKVVYFCFLPSLFKINYFKNKHQGQKIYLLGDSAEIKFYDLSLFDDAPMICFNQSYLINDIKQRKRETYALTVEPYYFIINRFRNLFYDGFLMPEYSRKYIKKNKILFFSSLTNSLVLSGSNIYNLFYKIPGDYFTNEVLKSGYKFNAGAFQTALTLAIYMGFKEVVVLGVSHHSGSVQNRWYHKGLGLENIKETDWPLNTPDRIDFMNLVKKYVNVTIITPNPSTSLFFKTTSYTDLTNRPLNYKENHEITDLTFLESVKNSNEYNIEVFK